jgi:hypothetical protein
MCDDVFVGHDDTFLCAPCRGTGADGQEGTLTGAQWALGGDTWVVGARIPDVAVLPEFNTLNPDMSGAWPPLCVDLAAGGFLHTSERAGTHNSFTLTGGVQIPSTRRHWACTHLMWACTT